MRELEEYRRLLYVALTRARDWLIVAGYEMKRFPVHPQSWYQAMDNAMNAMGVKPDADGVRVLGDAVVTATPDAPAISMDSEAPAFLFAPAPSEAPARILRPSDAAGEDEPPLVSPLADNTARFRRGLLVHALLAALPNVRPEARETAALRYLAREGIGGSDAQEILRETLAVLADPQFGPAFAEGSRAEVPVVAELPELGARTSGQIDRLAITADSVLIIDYKTNRPPPKEVTDVPAIYRTQMALYRAALQRIYPGKRVSCALIWTVGPRLMPLPDDLLEGELTKIRDRLVRRGTPQTAVTAA